LFYLAFYVIFSSIFTLCIKWVHVRGKEDIITAGAINYIVAAMIIAPWFFLDGQQTGNRAAIVAGGSMGLMYFINFFFVTWCVRVVGVSSTTVVGVLSLLMPIIYAAIVWGSQPHWLQTIGIALAFVSLILIGLKPDRQATALDGKATSLEKGAKVEPKGKTVSWKAPLILGCFFLLCGFSRIAQESFKYESVASQKPTFLLAAFVASGIPSIVLLLWRRKRILPMEAAIGIAMGVANGSQTWFTLKSLDAMAGYIFFPVSSAGGIIFTMFVAVLWMQEKISRRALIGIGVAVVALVMMNMR
jgi:drug/metabolite transporter (DMT)-like permease